MYNMTMININLESRNLKQQNSSIWVYVFTLSAIAIDSIYTVLK